VEGGRERDRKREVEGGRERGKMKARKRQMLFLR